VTAGATATFSIVAGANPRPPINGEERDEYSGRDRGELYHPATVAADNGAIFTVTAANIVGSVTSGNATLTVNIPPSITTQPSGQSVIVDRRDLFRWRPAARRSLRINGSRTAYHLRATAAGYTTPATVSGDNGTVFTVTVSNMAGNATAAARP